MTQTVPERHEIDPKYTWNLESVFPSKEAWAAAIEELQAKLKEVATFNGRLSEGPDVLADFLLQTEEILALIGKIYVYGGLQLPTDTTNQEAAAMHDRARSLFGLLRATLAFSNPELIAIGFDTLRDWMAQDKRLAPYAHQFDQLEKQQQHVRSAEVEEVMGLVSDTFGTANATHGILANSDLKFTAAIDSSGNEYDITQGNIQQLLTDADRDLRRSAWQNYADAHLTFKNTMANALAAGVKQNVFKARVRGYDSALDAALTSNFIPTEVFYNLLDTYKKHLPTWHRYWRVRRQALGYDKLHVYDVKAPLTANPPQVSYEQAVDWIAAGMAPLGKNYVETLRRGCLEERWVDVYPNKGKRMGAFSSGFKGTNPFIMMSYSDDLFGLSTLAHELGHSLHSYHTWQAQEKFSYTNYGLFVAETASNFNQAMVRAHLFETHSDRDFQIALIEEAMANFHRYFFIMPTLARFELEIHERVEKGQALNADGLIALMTELFSEGYGDEVEIDSDRIGITWGQFHSHLYANFYVYQYATGISAAHALAAGILQGQPNAVENYLAFLRAGGSVYPLDALKLAGVDMTAPEPVEQTFGVLAQIVDRLESLL